MVHLKDHESYTFPLHGGVRHSLLNKLTYSTPVIVILALPQSVMGDSDTGTASDRAPLHSLISNLGR